MTNVDRKEFRELVVKIIIFLGYFCKIPKKDDVARAKTLIGSNKSFRKRLGIELQ